MNRDYALPEKPGLASMCKLLMQSHQLPHQRQPQQAPGDEMPCMLSTARCMHGLSASMLYVQGEVRACQFFSSCSHVALPCSSTEKLQ